MFKLSISNIAWESENDVRILLMLKEMGFSALEIAPTRVFPNEPYNHLDEARAWSRRINDEYGLAVSSMQSIWYGRGEKIFGTKKDRDVLLNYTFEAILFAETIGCHNLVFGCPRNRNIPESISDDVAVEFFKEIGDYAWKHNTIIGFEANPPIYNTNYINNTKDALALIDRVSSPGFKLNLDVGTMVYNEESTDILMDYSDVINHVHISEPRLKPIQKRELHNVLSRFLTNIRYDKFVSIEVGRQEDICLIRKMMDYVKEIFR